MSGDKNEEEKEDEEQRKILLELLNRLEQLKAEHRELEKEMNYQNEEATAKGMEYVNHVTGIEERIAMIKEYCERTMAASPEEQEFDSAELEQFLRDDSERLQSDVKSCQDQIGRIVKQKEEAQWRQQMSREKQKTKLVELEREMDEMKMSRKRLSDSKGLEIQRTVYRLKSLTETNAGLRQELERVRRNEDLDPGTDLIEYAALLSGKMEEIEVLRREEREIHRKMRDVKVDNHVQCLKFDLAEARKLMLRQILSDMNENNVAKDENE